MKNNILVLLVLVTFIPGVFAQPGPSMCSASPEAIQITQPDGSTLTIVGKGNIHSSYTETVDGYTILKNQADIFEYAVATADGGLTPSGIPAQDVYSRPADQQKLISTLPLHLRESEAFNLAKDGMYKQMPGEEHHDEEIEDNAPFPSTGKRKILLLLIEYPDLPASYSKTDFENMMNQENYKGKGSFKDYYFQNSDGKFEVDITVMGWYMAKNNYKTYSRDSGNEAARSLVGEAIDSAEADGVDFSEYDNDGDGYVDGVLIIHAGPGAEEGSLLQFIWSHRWTMWDQERHYDGVAIDNYAINPETRGGDLKRQVGIGVFCHEFGHLLGLPDFYDTDKDDGESAGLGEWSVMAGGNWLDGENTPATFCAYTRVALGWTTPVVITEEGYYTMNPSVDDPLIYMIPTQVEHEYYLLENRQKKGFDLKLKGTGLAIWHVNDSIMDEKSWRNRVNSDAEHKAVDLEEADGLNHLDKNTNRGDAGDLFPGNFKRTVFDDDTNPAATNDNGNRSGIRLFDITELADSSIRFGFGSLPQADFAFVTGVCSGTPIQFENKSKFSSSYTWHFGDGSVDSIVTPVHQFDQPGKYYVTLTAKNALGMESRDSALIEIFALAEADFDVETAGLSITISNKTTNGKSYYWYWGDNKVSYNSEASFNRKYKEPGTYTIRLIAIGNGFCNDTIEKQVTVMYGVNIAELSEEVIQLKAYPNPASTLVNITYYLPAQAEVSIGIINTLGQRTLVKSTEKLEPGEQSIALDLDSYNMANGIYLLELNVSGKAFLLPIVKE
ncbi:MAG: M6 family metalloprotease domain-containing protein [Bacteroidota bacterium]|nr:M6 family metalloprotease domain-containing protein [Bacteroidota bacterium]